MVEHELVGRRVEGKYQVMQLVDETASSWVFRATHVLWNRPVALKVFKIPNLTADGRGDMLASFVREGALLAELSESCAAICQARDTGAFTTSDGTWLPYTVLEWLDGASLECVLAHERAVGTEPRSLIETLALVGPIAEALAVAHGHGVVHCDVKPGNVMVIHHPGEGQPACKLLDFGTAVMRGRPPRVRSLTPAYAAPEQFDAAYGEVGPWSDLFSLALVMVEVMTGADALLGQTLVHLSAQACDRSRRPTPRALGANVTDDVENIFSKALAVDADQRPADVRTFWGALSHAPALESRASEANIPILLRRRRAA